MDQLFPKPQKERWGKEIGFIRDIHFNGLDLHPSFLRPVSEKEYTIGEIEAEVFVGEFSKLYGFQTERRFLVSGDGYYMEIRKTGQNRAAIWIAAASPRGYYFSSLTFAQMLNLPLKEGWILDAPYMRKRGIVEGYYGKPWTKEERLRAFSVMSSQKMNTYIYAPKNDPFHREAWDSVYPPEEEIHLSNLIANCQQSWLDFVYALSPGFSIQYSSDEHLQLLMAKYAQIYHYNVRHFGLFFDDIPHNLYHSEDKEQFSDLAEAHIHLILSVYGKLKELDPKNELIICPTHYFGKGNESYIVRLGQALPEEILLFWTGRSICSSEIDVREARNFYENTRHRPLIWDNYPVNDANMRDEMHIGPLMNRHPKLFLHTTGWVANVMEYAEATLIPLITIGHYLWNPEKYNPQESFDFAVTQIAGEKARSSFLALSDCINQSVLSPLPGQDFMMKWFDYQREQGKGVRQKESFSKIVEEYVRYANDLIAMENEKLKEELMPWILEVKRDLEYLLEVLRYAEDPIKIKEISTGKFGNRVKALGFFPLLIAEELLWKKKS